MQIYVGCRQEMNISVAYAIQITIKRQVIKPVFFFLMRKDFLGENSVVQSVSEEMMSGTLQGFLGENSFWAHSVSE